MIVSLYSIFRFLFEILSVISIGYWGFQLRSLNQWRYVVGIAAAVLVIAVWAVWGAPASPNRLQGLSHFILELAIYLIAAVCLYFSHHKPAGIAFGIVGTVNAIVHFLWQSGNIRL